MQQPEVNLKAHALPQLRAELQLLPGTPDASGATRWLIHDPVQNRFIQIDATTYRLLACFRYASTRDDLAAVLASEGEADISSSEIDDLVAFLFANKLTTNPLEHGWRALFSEAHGAAKKTWSKAFHHYLFFRLPLVHPQAFLKQTLPVANLFASRLCHWLICLLGLCGLYLVSRQSDAYWTTFQNFFTPSGWIIMLLVLGLVKAAHELGHAYTAVRYNVRVATMGIAFMMMIPLLYTDVTDSWRLPERQKRLRIDSAGIRVELAIAAVSLFMWALLPDGVGRSIAFVLSAVTLISSLLINLNPFMRFDGYYLFSEVIGMENLQARAFALGKWRLREWLFKLNEPAPETFSTYKRAALITYAYATWVYRLLLFLGLALLVYTLMFKVLGIVLFVVEIVLLVLKPIWAEMKIWIQLRQEILSSRRTLVTLSALGVLLLAASVPWSTRVEIPAVLEFDAAQALYPPRESAVEKVLVRHGEDVEKGQTLVVLRAPNLDQDVVLTELRLRLAEMQYARRGSNARDLETSLIVETTIRSLRQRLVGLKQEIAQLTVVAPIAGHVLEINPELHPRRWISSQEKLMTISGPKTFAAKGYVREDDLWRIAIGSVGRFIPDFVTRASTDVTIETIGINGQSVLGYADLASPFGGPVAANLSDGERLVPTIAQYLVQMRAETPSSEPGLAMRGVVIVDGHPESLLARVTRQVLKVIMRETGM